MLAIEFFVDLRLVFKTFDAVESTWFCLCIAFCTASKYPFSACAFTTPGLGSDEYERSLNFSCLVSLLSMFFKLLPFP